MSELLKSWLTEEVGLHLKDVEQDFASGFLFGQLLQHYSMQPDFEKFEVKHTPDAMINNFTRLQTSFQKLGIKFDSRTANSVMREEPGVALRLLYALRQSLGQVQKDATKFQQSGKLGKELGATVPISRALLDAQQHNTSKEKYSTNNLKFFEETMRAKAENPNALMESMHLRKYMEQMYRQERQAGAASQQELSALASQRATFRSSEMGKLESARKDKSKKLEHDDAVHASLLKRKEELEREELRVELALSEKARRKKLEELSHSSLDVSLGIDAFEINLKRLVKVEGSADEGAALAAAGTGPLQGSPLEHLNKMKGMSMPVGRILEGSQGYLAGVKTQRAEDVATKREREARRRKVLVEQQQAAELAAAKAQEEALVATLARQSGEEQRLAERMWQLRQEKEAMREDRMLREQQYHERREKDWEDMLMREVELHRSMKEQYDAAAATEMEAWRAAQAQRAEAKAAKRSSMCQDIAWQLVQLAERTTEFRSRTGGNPPLNEFRRWVAMFVTGDPALGSPIITVDPATEEARLAQLEAERRVARAVVEDYLDCTGEFKREAGDIGLSAQLGAAVSDLVAICSPAPAEEDLPLLPYPLRLAVVGAPFAGKTSVAQELASRFQLRVLDVEKLVQAAIKEAEEYDKVASAAGPAAPAASAEPAVEGEGAEGAEGAPPAPAVPPMVLLGREAGEKLREGQDLPDELVVSVLVHAMQEVGKRPLSPPVELDAKGRPKPAGRPKPGAEVELVPQGFVVDGFPRTQAQSVLLERALTGLDLEKEAALVASASRLAPAPPGALPQLTRPLRSGLDAVLVLGLTDEATALKRALGRRVDPLTGKVYHLEFDPPPSNDPGLNARLQEVADDSNNAVQIQRRLTAYTAQSVELDEWLKRFIKLRRPVDGFGPRPEVMESAADVAAGIVRAKQAVASAKASVVAASKARAAAEKAQEYAELARGHAEAAARELLAAKKAEIAAAALLADPKSKVQDAAATEVLKAQSAAKCAESLKVCKAAAQDAAGYAERAAEAATAAGEAKSRAESSLGDAEVNASAEAEAKVHAEEAEVARQGAAEAAAKAEAARAAAEVAAAEADKWFAAETVAPDATVELAPPAESAHVDESAAAASTGEHAAPAPVPKQPVPDPLASTLLSEWQGIESSYFEGLVMAFINLAEQSGLVVQHFDTTRQTFTKLLQKPDGRAALVTQFQQQFNAFDVDARKLKETQAELVLRAEELRDTLWGLCDKKMEEAEAERSRLAADSFVPEQATVLGQYYAELLQVELDRCMSTLSFLKGFVSTCYGILPDPAEAAAAEHGEGSYDEGVFVAPDLLSGTIPPALKDQLDEKSKQALQFPAWLTALSGKSAPLVTALKVSYATLLGLKAWLDPSLVEETKGKGKGKGKEAKGRAAEDATPSIDPAVKEAIDAEMRAGAEREVEILEARLVLVAERAQAALESVAELAAGTHESVGQWIKKRYEAECSAVYALDRIVKAAAVAGEPLAHDLRLEDDGLTVDQSSLVVPRPAGLPAPPPRERQPPAGLLSTHQLASLVRLLKAMSPDGWLRIGDVAQLICSCTADGVLPAGWQGTSHSQVLSALRQFDPTSTGYVDWRELMCSLASAAFPALMQASCAEMSDQVFMLSEVDENRDGYLTEAQWNKVELWFQYKAFLPGSEEDLEADAAVKHQKAAYDSATALKGVLWDVFAQPLPGGSSSDAVQVNIRSVLLYLCPTKDMFLGIKKAFSVATASTTAKADATSSITTNAKADVQQVLNVVYPLGPEAGQGVSRSLFSLEDVQKVVASIYDSRQPAPGSAAAAALAASTTPLPTPPYVTAEQIMYSAAGERLVVQQLHRYQWKDLYIATKIM